ncbi:hypothetical protein F5B19DRAFT_421564 [Rostrohypoxylon terebratum]|nr:hypothetical protein F5B19DRAFT_421564 [Rostrohypoxylon terebratum]
MSIMKHGTESFYTPGYWKNQEETLTFRPDRHTWYDMDIIIRHQIDWRVIGHIELVKLAFDFEFNPTIILARNTNPHFHSITMTTRPATETTSVFDTHGGPLRWSPTRTMEVDGEWKEAFPFPSDMLLDHGLWVLRGDRIKGLRVVLQGEGVKVNLFKKTNYTYNPPQYSWYLDITNAERYMEMQRDPKTATYGILFALKD